MFVGGLLLTISCLTSAFVGSVDLLIPTYGIIGGIVWFLSPCRFTSDIDIHLLIGLLQMGVFSIMQFYRCLRGSYGTGKMIKVSRYALAFTKLEHVG